MYNLLGLLVFCFSSHSIPVQEFYYYKDSLITEILSINRNSYYECYRKASVLRSRLKK